jgi:FKBP-type peptidyl-prolyl cis-trans isomerase
VHGWKAGLAKIGQRESLMRFLVALFMVAGFLGTLSPALAVDDALSIQANEAYLKANAAKPGVIVRPSGLQYKILRNGYGEHPNSTDTVTVYYTGKLINGTIFDGTSPGLPATFTVNKVIPGWAEALQLMRVGDHWILTIPAHLAYGVRGAGNGVVPPSQTLVFDVRLLSTKPAPKKGEPGYVPQPGDNDQQQ